MNYYSRHIGDYVKTAGHLTLLEHGVFSRLVDIYFAREGPIPDDQTARLLGARSREELKALRGVLAEFFVLRDGQWFQSRCEEEIARFRDKQLKAAASANVRWRARESHGEGNATATPSAMQTHCHGVAPIAQEPTANHQTPITREVAAKAAPNLSEIVSAGTTTAARGYRLSRDWTLPPDWREWAMKLRPDLNVTVVADAFRDHWVSKSGADATKVDWEAAWRNWVRRERAQGVLVAASTNPMAGMTFKERDTVNARRRWEEMSGRPHPDLPAHLSTFANRPTINVPTKEVRQ